jgi:hypothetical protein
MRQVLLVRNLIDEQTAEASYGSSFQNGISIGSMLAPLLRAN